MLDQVVLRLASALAPASTFACSVRPEARYLQILPVAGVAGEVEVEMVVVPAVVVGAEHGREHAARAAVDGAQEIALRKRAAPAVLEVDDGAVLQDEARDVDGVGVAMLGEEARRRRCSSAGRNRSRRR